MLTPNESNALIAKALTADPDPKWQGWAMTRVPDRYHFIPRDFASDENTLKLIEWAAAQLWHGDPLKYDGTIGSVGGHIRFYMDRLIEGLVDAPETASQVRDIIAERLEEVEDAR